MKEIFIKKYWDEEDTLFYLHFQDGMTVRQIEIRPTGFVKLSLANPVQGESFLYDQNLVDLELAKSDYITSAEFNKVWESLEVK